MAKVKPPKLSVSIENLDTVKQQLLGLPGPIREAGERAVEAEVEDVAQDMRDAAPVLTGELVGSIQAEHEGLEGRAVATAQHAFAVEFGTSRMPAQPYAQPAAEASRTRFPGQLSEAIREELGLK